MACGKESIEKDLLGNSNSGYATLHREGTASHFVINTEIDSLLYRGKVMLDENIKTSETHVIYVFLPKALYDLSGPLSVNILDHDVRACAIVLYGSAVVRVHHGISIWNDLALGRRMSRITWMTCFIAVWCVLFSAYCLVAGTYYAYVIRWVHWYAYRCTIPSDTEANTKYDLSRQPDILYVRVRMCMCICLCILIELFST